MLKIYTGPRQTGKTSNTIQDLLKTLSEAKTVCMSFPSEMSAGQFLNTMLTEMFQKKFDVSITPKEIAKLFEQFGITTVFALYHSISSLEKQVKDYEVVIIEDWTCQGEEDFEKLKAFSENKIVIVSMQSDSLRRLPMEKRRSPQIVHMEKPDVSTSDFSTFSSVDNG